LIRVELVKLVRNRRTWVTIALIDALPSLVAVLLAVTDLGPRPGTGPAFLSAVLTDGTLFPLAAMGIVLPLFLPIAVAITAGEAIAGESQQGTLRYMLVRPVGRTRLLVAKLVAVMAFVVLAVVVVAVTAYVLGLLLLAGILAWRRRRRRPRRRGQRRTPIPPAIRQRVYARDGRACRYCGRTGRGVILELDHLFPVARGGGDEIGNLVTACRECNRAKGATVQGDERAMDRFVAERRDAADAMSRAAWRRAVLRNVVVPVVLIGMVAVLYVILTTLVW